MKFFIALLALSVCVAAKTQSVCSRGDPLEADDVELLRSRYASFIGDMDLIEAKYGTVTGPLSFSNGSGGNLVPAMVGAMAADFTARMVSEPAVNGLVYFEKDSDTGNITTVNISNIALGLAEFSVIPCELVNPVPPIYVCVTLYGEFQHLGGMVVAQVDDNTFSVSASVHTVGRIPNSALASTFANGYPTSDAQMITFNIIGVRRHVYERVCDNANGVTYYLSEIDTGLKYDFHGPIALQFYNGNPYPN